MKAEGRMKNAEKNRRARLFLHSLFCILPSLTVAAAEEEIPKLAPPCPVLPPTFWEQHGSTLLLASLAALLLVALVVWRWLRPKPAAVIPPEVMARQALELLRSRPEDGAALSQISQILHRYFRAAFGLAPGELTTAEFCQTLAVDKNVGPQLAAAAGYFLRECDARKFSPAATPPLGAATRALELIAQAEARRAELHADATPPQSRA